MLEAAIIGRGRSTPGLFSMRRRILRWRRFNWRWRLAFTRKPPGGERLRSVKYLDCSPEPGGFRASEPRSASNYACFRTRTPAGAVRPAVLADRVRPRVPAAGGAGGPHAVVGLAPDRRVAARGPTGRRRGSGGDHPDLRRELPAAGSADDAGRADPGAQWAGSGDPRGGR